MKAGHPRLGYSQPWLPLVALWFAWTLMSTAVMLAYAERHQFGWRLLGPHLAVVSCVLALLLAACLLIARMRLSAAFRRRLLIAMLAGAHFLLLACYALFFISWEAWDQAASFTVVAAYLPQLPQLLQALPVSGALVAGIGALALAVVVIPYALASSALLRSFDWAAETIAARSRHWTRTWRLAMLVTALIVLPGLVAQATWSVGATAATLNEPFFQAILDPGKELETMRLDPAAAIREAREREIAAAYVAPSTVRKKNLFIITVDALRADKMSVYGAERDTTPFLSKLRQDGRLTRVDNAFSACAESFCGVLGILSSRYWHQAILHRFGLAEVLKRLGFQVAYLMSGDKTNFYGQRDAFGFSMDLYRDGSTAAGYINDDANVLDWLAELKPRTGVPQFAYIHLMSVHTLGNRHPEFRKWEPSSVGVRNLSTADLIPAYVNNYDNGILQADAMIERIFGLLRKKGLLEDAVVIITADHGDLIGEQGRVGHGRSALVDPLVRVPLLIYDSEGYRYPPRPMASTVDVAPTLLHRIGAPIPANWAGEALGAPARREAVVMQSSIDRAVVVQAAGELWKYYDGAAGGSARLFNLTRDPQERSDLMAGKDLAVPEVSAAMAAAYRTALSTPEAR